MRLTLFSVCVSAFERLISTRSRHELYGHEMWHLNAVGKLVCRLVAGKNVSDQKSFLHELIYNSLDSLNDGLDYLRFCEMHREFIAALEGDDSERVSVLLMNMTCTGRYNCTSKELGNLYDLVGSTKHWKHFYREYC